ncbi:DAN domain family member 5 [Thalassophryne amazonica]|uniref:DAN domain family member 5 n=1 Tax=Thalassophryne amazonica TaxID=390379 RepID=UPI001472286A|nr:DAN domain family member 5 [Thalassophryne amazonica]
MDFGVITIFLLSWTAATFTFPYSAFDRYLKASKMDFESSGDLSDDLYQGSVKVVRVDPRVVAQSGLLAGGFKPRRLSSLRSRSPFPAFLSQGHPGPVAAAKAPVSPLHHLHPKKPSEVELKKKQGLQMWQKAIDKVHSEKTSLPVSLKDMKQTCAAVAFTQHVMADGCDTVTVHNKLCFGQCSSLFVPSGGDTGVHRRAACSRCAPSRAHTVPVSLRCGGHIQQKEVMIVEECKCETGREEKNIEAAAFTHMLNSAVAMTTNS